MPSSSLSDLIFAKGDMAERTRLFDWSSTAIGPVATWPSSLLTTVNLILDSKFPMFIWWGEDKIQFYNDAYLEILGTGENSKHPRALGQTGEQCWAEAWPVISPLIEGVLRSGESVYLEDQLIPIYRKGKLDDVYWTFCYSPVRSVNGNTEGILVICTETTKTNQQLKENEDQLNRVLDHMAEGVGITDRAGRIIYANPMAHQILHTQGDVFPERKSNSPEWFNVHLDGRPMRDEDHPTMVAMATGKPVFNYEFAIEAPGTDRIYLTMNAAPITDPDGNITGSVGMFTDITSRKKAEDALQTARDQSEKQRRLYETINSATPDLIYVFDLDYKFTYVNKALLDMWGKTWDTAVGKGLRENGYEEWHALMHEQEIDHIRNTKEMVRGEVAFPHATLGRRVYDYILRPVTDETGDVVAVAGTTRDITDIKNAEAAIAESEVRFRLMAEGTDVMIAVGDASGAAVYFNQPWVAVTGRTKEDLLKLGWIDLIHPEDKKRVQRIYADAFAAKQPWECEFRMPDRKGTYRWLLARGLPRFQSDGAFAGYISSTIDITEQKEQRERLQSIVQELQATNEELATTNEEIEAVNEELRQTQESLVNINEQLKESEKNLISANNQLSISEQTLQTAVQSANLGTWVIDAEARKIFPSPRVKELFGFNADEEMPLNAAIDQIVDEHRERVIKAIDAAIEKGESYDIEYPVVGFRDKKIRWVKATGKLYVPEDGQPPSFSGTIADITEQKQNEQRKNDFISMVSHELKTPLTSTISYVQVSQKKAAANGDTVAEGMLRRAGLQLGKMTTLINGFLNVSRLEAGMIHIERQRFDMAVLMKEVGEGIVSDASSHKIYFAPVEETWVNVDKEKIEQVINNFISNAIKYSPPNTTIQVACVTRDSYAYVTVKDEGMGIKPQDQQRLFDRYYRVEAVETKSISGFGIGLYICKEIVERHEGKIGVESVPGAGSTFWFALPVEFVERTFSES
jgi:PAS domain S-box-containing protein